MAHSLATGLGQQGEGHRVEYLPVEWRYELKLDGDIVHTVTPSKLRGIRDLLNSSVLDVLYYTSPVYRQEIIHALHSKLNRLYEMFISRNPQFVERGGKVSVVAHSLGCVLIHDILTGWNPIHQYEDYVSSTIEDEGSHIDNVSDLLKELKETRKRATALEDRLFAAVRSQHCHPLKFQVDSLFFLGSPLAVFLALRGVRPTASGSTEHIIARSLCRRVYNVYHPTDPVAYRLEPLVLKHYTQLMPLRVHRYDSSDMRPYESLPNIPYRDAKHDVSSATAAAAAAGATDPFTEIEEEAAKDSEAQSHRSHQSPSRFSGLFSRWSSKKVPAVSKTYIVDELSTIDSDASSASSTPTLPHKHPHTHPRASQSPTNSRAQSPTDHLVSLTNQATAYKDVICDNEPIIEHTDLEYRLDYQLHESKMAPQYYSALTSHTAYWTNPDVALFVYTQLLHTCAATRSKPPTHKL